MRKIKIYFYVIKINLYIAETDSIYIKKRKICTCEGADFLF